MLEQKGQPPLQTFRDGAVVVKLWRQESPSRQRLVCFREPSSGLMPLALATKPRSATRDRTFSRKPFRGPRAAGA